MINREDASIDLNKCRSASMAAMGLGRNCFEANDGMIDISVIALPALMSECSLFDLLQHVLSCLSMNYKTSLRWHFVAQGSY